MPSVARNTTANVAPIKYQFGVVLFASGAIAWMARTAAPARAALMGALAGVLVGVGGVVLMRLLRYAGYTDGMDISSAILSVLSQTEPLPGIAIIERIEDRYGRRVGPAQLHQMLAALAATGRVRPCAGKRLVDVPGPSGTMRRQERTVYLLGD